LLVVVIGASVASAEAQTDEIQVYDGSITAPGKFNLTLHNNWIAEGRNTPAFPGGLVPDESLNGVPEWAYGVTPWFETGLYFPLYSISKNRGATFNGFKLRALFVAPHAAERTFFYGVNFESSYNARHWDPSRFTSELRPILGWHLSPVDLIFNPILDTDYSRIGNLDFAPATRAAYNFSPKWAVAAEEYSDFGPVRRFNSWHRQSHQLFGVIDHHGKFLDVEFGVGFGLTDASDHLTLKLILSRDLN
ncbi:MAG TPA: hypothetical protein VGI88_01380, partial [Verrucomicrobiae bacterium]